MDFPGSSVLKNPLANARDADLIPGSGISPGVENGNPLQCSCLVTVHEVVKSQTWLSTYVHACTHTRTHSNIIALKYNGIKCIFVPVTIVIKFSSVAQSCPTVCDLMGCSMPGFPVHHQLPELTQTHVHWVNDAIQPSQPLSSPSPPTFSLSQHQGLFQWVRSLHQVAKVLEPQLQYWSFQWIFRTDFI